MPAVVRRWHGVSSKYFIWASARRLFVVHGAAAVSRSNAISPRLVVSVTVYGCLSSTSVVGGSLTGLAAGSVLLSYAQLPGGRAAGAALADALGPAEGAAVPWAAGTTVSGSPPRFSTPIATTAATTSEAASPTARTRLRCLLRAAAAARRDACRSARCRASSFSRLLLATPFLLDRCTLGRSESRERASAPR